MIKETSACVILFLRAPRKGKVKTRLAKTLGDDTVLALYKFFVIDVLQAVERTGFPVVIYFDPDDAEDELRNWLDISHDMHPQIGTDLGEKMDHAFRETFSFGFLRSVLIGTDCPHIRPEIIETAQQNLTESDMVIGPSFDGGYYLIGFRKDTFSQSVFQHLPWGTETVLEKTLEICEKKGLSVKKLPGLQDIDTLDDLKSFYREKNKQPHTPEYSATLSYLSSIQFQA
ncbi:MAG: TIGR04282 family arsenosugar biosynthesis glycosyltransferase [Proteobacteria bacterium]|nr:TIGR04282 family arsenosugar biosynthesis glycosyltransferase [Pseudomonadota bacterium]